MRTDNETKKNNVKQTNGNGWNERVWISNINVQQNEWKRTINSSNIIRNNK